MKKKVCIILFLTFIAISSLMIIDVNCGTEASAPNKKKIINLKQSMRDEKKTIFLILKMAQFANFCHQQGQLDREYIEREYRLFRYEFIRYLQAADQDDISAMSAYLDDPAAESFELPYVLLGLISAHSRHGNPGRAIFYHSRLIDQFPEHELTIMLTNKLGQDEVAFRISLSDINRLKKAKIELERITASHLPPDQFLWEKGLVYNEMMILEWNRREVGYDLSLPDSLFSKLINLYPDSAFADDAWWMIYLSKLWDGEMAMDYLDYYLPKYEGFVHRFPQSELVPVAKYHMASAIRYVVQVSEEYDSKEYEHDDSIPKDERYGYLQRAEKLCIEAMKAGYPDKDTHEEVPDFKKTLREIDDLLKKYTLKRSYEHEKQS